MTEPRRDRWGRYIIPDPETGEDREWTRATTIAGVLPDRFNLERWGERMVAFGLAQRDDLLLLAQSIQDPKAEKHKLNKIARDAKSQAQAGAKANIGTALHAFTELWTPVNRRRFRPWRSPISRRIRRRCPSSAFRCSRPSRSC
jgi:hypothetical protein